MGRPPYGVARKGRLLTGARIETTTGLTVSWQVPRRLLTGARIETEDAWRQDTARYGRLLTGARIETVTVMAVKLSGVRSPPHGGADRNSLAFAGEAVCPRSPPHGGADRNALAFAGEAVCPRSPPHGGADRNRARHLRRRSARCRLLTGARIETYNGHSNGNLWETSPPHGGADRNSTTTALRPTANVASSRGRGSKRLAECDQVRHHAVASSRGRGSKPVQEGLDTPACSRLLTGARIETCGPCAGDAASAVASSRGRGSKRSGITPRRRPVRRSPPHGGADRNVSELAALRHLVVSPPHGGADRNTYTATNPGGAAGRLLTGARIETDQAIA